MPRLHPLLAVALALTACSAPEESSPGVLLDGLFGEWPEAAHVVDDAPDAPGAAVDILSVMALDEAPWLYLMLDVGNEVTLQALPGTLHLLIDTDGSSRTGDTVSGMDGVDLVVDLAQTATPVVPGRGTGFALRAVESDGTVRDVERYALGLTVAPTWSAPRFELRLSRLGGDGVAPFGSRIRLSAVYAQGDSTVDETGIGTYSFRTSAAAPTPPDATARLARDDGTLRVAQWNVSSGSFDRHTADFARVLAAVEPDVLLLDELPGDIDSARVEALFAQEPLSRLGDWSFALGRTGAGERAAVAARDRPLRTDDRLLSFRHPPGALDRLAQAATDEAFRARLALEAERGISAAGAWVDTGAREVLFIATDLRSRGWNGSPEDDQRTLQATAIHEAVSSELRSHAGPVVIGGDLNMVGSRRPLFALVRGLDVDDSDLLPVDAERLGERTLATWRNPNDLFTPGRLDFLLVPDAASDVVSSFVFATDDLDEATLARLGLERALSTRLSDHLPTVADLRFGLP